MRLWISKSGAPISAMERTRAIEVHRPGNVIEIIKIIKALRKHSYCIAINLYPIGSYLGSVKMGVLFLLIKAEINIGHDKKPFGLLLDKKLPDDVFRDNHLADAMMKMVELAGGLQDGSGLKLFWNKDVEAKWDLILKDSRASSKKIIGVNPGGDRPNRRWNLINYSKIADLLIRNINAEIFIFGGPGEEKIAYEIRKRMRYTAKNLCGKLSLDELIFLISELDLLVSNDSGPMHIAAATKTPVVAIFGPENSNIFRPYTTADLYRVVQKDIDCKPAYLLFLFYVFLGYRYVLYCSFLQVFQRELLGEVFLPVLQAFLENQLHLILLLLVHQHFL